MENYGIISVVFRRFFSDTLLSYLITSPNVTECFGGHLAHGGPRRDAVPLNRGKTFSFSNALQVVTRREIVTKNAQCHRGKGLPNTMVVERREKFYLMMFFECTFICEFIVSLKRYERSEHSKRHPIVYARILCSFCPPIRRGYIGWGVCIIYW